MKTGTIDNLIDQTRHYFTQGNLELARSTANRALALSDEATYHDGIIHSNLLLGRIHNSTGKYRGDNIEFPRALSYINKAARLSQELTSQVFSIDILLALGQVAENEKKHQESAGYFKEALEKSSANNHLAGTIRSLCALSQNNLHQNQYDQALGCAEESLRLIQAESEKEMPLIDQQLLLEVYNQLSLVHLKRQEYDQILQYSEPLLEISRELGDIERELNALNNLAVVNSINTDYQTAMVYLLDALEKSKQINFRMNIAQCLINIGTIYGHLFNYEESLNRYLLVLDEYDDVLEEVTRVILYNNIGYNHSINDRYDEAKTFFKKALNLANAIGYKNMIALSMAQICRLKLSENQHELATEYAQKASVYMNELGDVNGKQIHMLNLSRIAYNEDAFQKAARFASQGIVASKRMKDQANEIRGYQLLANIYKDAKDFEQAFKYQELHNLAKEGYTSLQLSRQVTDLEIKYAIKDKQRKIEQLTRENEYQSLLLDQSDQIGRQNRELLQVNEELRQFAYVASHDLKEPLRMIGSYTQLIYRLHGKEFNEDSTAYFDYVKEGVNRMNNLLDALLRYATVGKSDEDRKEVVLKDVVEIALINLRVAIAESSAIVEQKDLPVVLSSKSLLIQVFQNLISNAIKFKKPDVDPHITISYTESEAEYMIAIEDNGIGIDSEFQDRIFVIFQRLHTRNKYEGTGIGLAICQKIMKRLGGRIWFESAEDQGATFFITLPKSSKD